MAKALTTIAAATVVAISTGGAAESFQRLSGNQIRAGFTAMQLTDEVHWRYVFDRDGGLRSYAMGTKKFGKWSVKYDELCLYLNEPDDGCYQVSRLGNRIEIKPSGLGLAAEGLLQTPADRN